MQFNINKLKNVADRDITKVSAALREAESLSQSITIPDGFGRSGDVKDINMWVSNCKKEVDALVRDIKKKILLLEQAEINNVFIANNMTIAIDIPTEERRLYKEFLKTGDIKLKEKYLMKQLLFGEEVAIREFSVEIEHDFRFSYENLPEEEKKKFKNLTYVERYKLYLSNKEYFDAKAAEEYEKLIRERYDNYMKSAYPDDPTYIMYKYLIDSGKGDEAYKLFKNNETNKYDPFIGQRIKGNLIGMLHAAINTSVVDIYETDSDGITGLAFALGQKILKFQNDKEGIDENYDLMRKLIGFDAIQKLHIDFMETELIEDAYKYASDDWKPGGLYFNLLSFLTTFAGDKALDGVDPIHAFISMYGNKAQEVIGATNEDTDPLFVVDLILRRAIPGFAGEQLQKLFGDIFKKNSSPMNNPTDPIPNNNNPLIKLLKGVGIDMITSGGTAVGEDLFELMLTYDLSQKCNEDETFRELYGDCVDAEGNIDPVKILQREGLNAATAAGLTAADNIIKIGKTYYFINKAYSKNSDGKHPLIMTIDGANVAVSDIVLGDIPVKDMPEKVQDEILSILTGNYYIEATDPDDHFFDAPDSKLTKSVDISKDDIGDYYNDSDASSLEITFERMKVSNDTIDGKKIESTGLFFNNSKKDMGLYSIAKLSSTDSNGKTQYEYYVATQGSDGKTYFKTYSEQEYKKLSKDWVGITNYYGE